MDACHSDTCDGFDVGVVRVNEFVGVFLFIAPPPLGKAHS